MQAWHEMEMLNRKDSAKQSPKSLQSVMSDIRYNCINDPFQQALHSST